MKLQATLKVLFATVSVSSLMLAGCTQQEQLNSQAQNEASPSAVEVQQRSTPSAQPAGRTPDVVYVPTPPEVVNRMLTIAKVGKNDVLYDLGSGDGRIPIAAVQKYGVKKAVGIDIDPQRIKEANENAQKAGLTGKVQFLQQDLFTTDFSDATVVTLYLLPELNVKLRPQILKLKPGTRIVSHAFDMGEWKPEKTEQVDGRTIYFWTVPKQIPANLQQSTPSS
ncbi:class I SAM-dependent methyltransferase [Brasilonema octagenarum]|uniref:SAM-dependent methyltransferase n=1 Tax=Brasilonema octagenarum UFV-OR1 TaxID=417115 RepID=A0ABX1MEE8_9CYAN|nr:class I SAM-dependent methyltransferase [Brasilonema octagenarum]NMF65821.1 SAM-dependent methyltransferase [Brasilonema octagenarum UFV-OR1]